MFNVPFVLRLGMRQHRAASRSYPKNPNNVMTDHVPSALAGMRQPNRETANTSI